MTTGEEMNTRLGIRISRKLRKELDDAVKSGQFKNISDLLRQALEKFLESRRNIQLLNPKSKTTLNPLPKEAPKSESNE
jgi:Arc/MetJ-type ribon-helix-helix transcriptional regulator